MRNITIMVSILLLTGCFARTYNNAPNDVVDDCRKESTFQSYNADVDDYYGQATIGPELNDNMMQKCIKARGYKVKEVDCWLGRCTAPTFD